MSLIRCPECKQAMSDTLSVRLHCGYNLSDEEKRDFVEKMKRKLFAQEETKHL